MTRVRDAAAAREGFERTLAGLVGRRVTAVSYWDLRYLNDEPRVWEYPDGDHAVMGVELTTDAGPATVLWSDTFYSYGVEAFDEPIDRHLERARRRRGMGRRGPRPVAVARWAAGAGGSELLGPR